MGGEFEITNVRALRVSLGLRAVVDSVVAVDDKVDSEFQASRPVTRK